MLVPDTVVAKMFGPKAMDNQKRKKTTGSWVAADIDHKEVRNSWLDAASKPFAADP